jgi:branched-chain amino acid transport system ATP-binding protein
VSEPLLRVDHLTVNYGAIEALQDLCLEVYPGEIVTLIGSNGAGKSTTLRAISRLIPLRAGRIEFKGQPLNRCSAAKVVAQGIAQSPEGRRVLTRQSVEVNLELGAYLRRDQAGIRADLEQMFELFPRLRERRRQLAGTLSGGEQQMLAIARALMSRPQLLLLDEPSLGLAPQIVQDIFGIIHRINQQGTTILLVEQNARYALKMAQRGYVLEAGQLLLSGPAEVLINDVRVKQAYLG